MAQLSKNKGFFIVFEGPDGSGKSTIIKLVEKYLLKKFPKKVFLTREPGGTNNLIAEDIRNIVLNKMDYKIYPMAEALLFAASRAQHVSDFIKPHLLKNDIILCDRFVFSSLIYQGIGRGLGFDKVKKINDYAIDGIMPNLTFLLMIKPEDGLKRISTNSKREVNRLDNESIEMHKKVYDGYLKLSKKYSNNVCIINANQSVEKVFKDVVKVLSAKLKIHE